MPPAPDAAHLSYRHQKVQRLRRLMSRRSARQADNAFVAEGAKLLKEALAAGAPVEAVFRGPGADDESVAAAYERGARVYELDADTLRRVTDTVTPQPIVAIVGYVDVALEVLKPRADNWSLVVCIDVRDPGNAGTVLRSAEASGAAGVIFSEGSVDVYNPKTVRASAGSLFHVPVCTGGTAVEVLDALAAWGVRRLATVAHGGVPYDECPLDGAVALVLGNEAHGLPDELATHIDGAVTIPMTGRTESLNVGMAAAVLCFEASRQRRSRS